MNKPTKAQLTAAVTHYQTSIQSLVDTYMHIPDSEEFLEALVHIQESAPSLAPVAKTTVNAEVTVETTTEEPALV